MISQPERAARRAEIAEIFEQNIRRMRCEILGSEDAGRDRDGPGPDGAGAGNIVRRVAYHESARKRDGVAAFNGTRKREWSEFVALMMIVCKCPELEVVPHPVVRQLVLRAPREIACQQREHDIRAWLQCSEQIADARQQPALNFGKQSRKVAEVAFQNSADGILRLGATVLSQKLTRDSRVGAARDLDVVQIVLDAEGIHHRMAERTLTAAAAREQGSIDVE